MKNKVIKLSMSVLVAMVHSTDRSKYLSSKGKIMILKTSVFSLH